MFRCLAACSLLALFVPALALAQADAADDERARTHFTAGRAYFEEGNYEEALEEFNHAYALSARAPLLVNIANCQERLGQWREAADTLTRYRETLAADDAERSTIERRVEALRQRADTHEAEEAARLARERELAASAATPTPSPVPATRVASDGLLVPSIVAFAIGGASLIAWGVLGGLALAEESSVAGGCGATRSCTPDQVRSMDDLALGADIAMSIGLVGVAAGLVMILVDPPHGGSEATARLSPYGGPNGGGLALEGSF